MTRPVHRGSCTSTAVRMHGFTVRGIERPGCAYDERADRGSWAAMVALLDETIRA